MRLRMQVLLREQELLREQVLLQERELLREQVFLINKLKCDFIYVSVYVNSVSLHFFISFQIKSF